MPSGIYDGNDGKAVADFQLNKTHCPKGHLYDEENTVRWASQPGSRRCAICERERGLKKWNKMTREERREYHLQSKFKMSTKEFNELVISQKNVCAICGCSETAKDKIGRIKPLSVDHDHKTGKIRGLLCINCNTGIGVFKEDKQIMMSAIKYMENI
jgi:hypothetical protein